MSQKNTLNYKLIATVFTAFIFGIALLVFAYKIGCGSDVYPVTYLICLAGCILGWLIGMLTTPYDLEDEIKLGKFSKLIGTFLSGYILSKFDRVIEEIINPTSMLTPIIGLRVLLFVCFFCLMWIVVFVFRQYADA